MDSEHNVQAEVSVRPFNFSPVDYNELKRLHNLQNSPTEHDISLKTLPSLGFVAFTADKVVAMGFLRLVEGGFGQIDTLVSNPEASGDERNIGLNLVVGTIIKEARDFKLTALLSLTTSPSILSRSKMFGFKKIDMTPISLIL